MVVPDHPSYPCWRPQSSAPICVCQLSPFAGHPFLFLLICVLWEWLLPVSVTSMVVTKWWFSVSVICFTCINWRPAIRNSFPFLPFVYSFILFISIWTQEFLYNLVFVIFLFTLMLKFSVIWPVGALSPCPFNLSLSFVEHFLTFRQKRFPDSPCSSPAPGLEWAILPRNLVPFHERWCLGSKIWARIYIHVLVSTYMYIYKYIHTYILYIHVYSLHLKVCNCVCVWSWVHTDSSNYNPTPQRSF